MHNKLTVDLNCDLGERFGTDEDILPYISSANIACGFHAGDPVTMMNTVTLALKHQVAIGAHPAFDDLDGFGRREMKISPREVYALVVYQIGALSACAKAQDGVMHHVKPHGALYNMAVKDADLADAIAQAIYDTDPTLVLYGLSGSALIHAGKKKRLAVYHEVFADRTYQPDGTLTARTAHNAVINDNKQAVDQVIQMVKEGKVTTIQGVDIPIQADTVCIHGDNLTAVNLAREIRQALKDQHIAVR